MKRAQTTNIKIKCFNFCTIFLASCCVCVCVLKIIIYLWLSRTRIQVLFFILKIVSLIIGILYIEKPKNLAFFLYEVGPG